jgi:hypothetical protein
MPADNKLAFLLFEDLDPTLALVSGTLIAIDDRSDIVVFVMLDPVAGLFIETFVFYIL